MTDTGPKELQLSRSKASLTIMSYIVSQGISPLIWGPLSDTLGRRPIYIASFSVYILANIVLSITPNYATLVVFRALQAVGSASTVSIGELGHVHSNSPIVPSTQQLTGWVNR